MILQPIVVDEKRQEIIQHGTKGFPVSMNQQHVSSQSVQRIPHWHYDIQIVLVTQGSLIISVPNGEFRLAKGNGVFINSCVLHEILPTEEEDSKYICVNFDPNVIYGQSDSLIYENYVLPIIMNRELPTVPLYEEDWHKKICNQMERMAQLEERRPYGYELAMKIILDNIWYQLTIKLRDRIDKAVPLSLSDRKLLMTFQRFVHENYMQRITLGDIAASGSVSKSECCRIFREALDTSPVAYLGKYRLQQSVRLLTDTELRISEVAKQSGFQNTDYFIMRFREETGSTPLKYRKHSRKTMAAEQDPI